jgi:hypothetical protein
MDSSLCRRFFEQESAWILAQTLHFIPTSHTRAFFRLDGTLSAAAPNTVSAVAGHLDLHFRLMRQDLLADLCDAAARLKAEGGILGLDARMKVSICSRLVSSNK